MRADLFLHELKLLGFQELFGYALRAALSTQQQLPELLAKRGGIFFEESSQLDL